MVSGGVTCEREYMGRVGNLLQMQELESCRLVLKDIIILLIISLGEISVNYARQSYLSKTKQAKLALKSAENKKMA